MRLRDAKIERIVAISNLAYSSTSAPHCYVIRYVDTGYILCLDVLTLVVLKASLL